jgi:hypothetical protein
MNPWLDLGMVLECFARGRILGRRIVGGVSAQVRALCLVKRRVQEVDMKLGEEYMSLCEFGRKRWDLRKAESHVAG